MKFVLALWLMFSFGTVFAQKEIISTNNETVALGMVEKKPEFPGGIQEFYAYIGRSFKTPNVKDLSGRVVVSFVIDKDGSVVDIKVIRDLGYGTGAEAVRVIENSPKWIPGEQLGEKVRVQYMLPIAIRS
jgi:protein TonB